ATLVSAAVLRRAVHALDRGEIVRRDSGSAALRLRSAALLLPRPWDRRPVDRDPARRLAALRDDRPGRVAREATVHGGGAAGSVSPGGASLGRCARVRALRDVRDDRHSGARCATSVLRGACLRRRRVFALLRRAVLSCLVL